MCINMYRKNKKDFTILNKKNMSKIGVECIQMHEIFQLKKLKTFGVHDIFF